MTISLLYWRRDYPEEYIIEDKYDSGRYLFQEKILPYPHADLNNISCGEGNLTSPVPNIVHYIWYVYQNNPIDFTFLHFLSVLSVHKFIQPNCILFHTNGPPEGIYWDEALKIPEFHVVWRLPTTRLFDYNLLVDAYDTTASDLDRLLILNKWGGIYLDTDVLALRSFSDLLKYDITLGMERPNQICGAVIVSSNKSGFLKLWIQSFLDDYRPRHWAYNSGTVSFKDPKTHIWYLSFIKSCGHRIDEVQLIPMWSYTLTSQRI